MTIAMNSFRAVLLGLIAGIMLCATSYAQAYIPDVYTNDTFSTSRHDAPAWFYRDHLGVFYGATETGKLFRQFPITNELGVRLMRFEIDEAFFYITDRGIIWAENDLVALSIYVSRA